MSNATYHHEFSPSKLRQFELCPYAYTLTKGLPDVPSEASDEGVMLHAAMQEVIGTGVCKFTELDDEQNEALHFCVNVLNGERSNLIALHNGGVGLRTMAEVPMRLFSADGMVPSLLTEGTADCVVCDADGNGVVIDWKFGRGEVDAACDNLQLAAYMAMAEQQFALRTVRGVICQPRLHKTSDVYIDDAPSFARAIADTVAGIIRACKAEGAKPCPGEEQCKYCRGKVNCPALKAAVRETADLAERVDAAYLPADITDNELGELYARSLVAEQFCKAIKDELQFRIKQAGQPVGGWAIRETSGGYELPPADKLFEIVNGVLTAREFCGICKTTMNALQDAFARKAQAIGAVPSVKAGKKMLQDLLKEELTPKPPRVSIVKAKEEKA